MTLEDAFQQVDGVGDVKAAQLAELAREHGENAAVRENLQEAMSYYNNGNYEYAGKFLERAYEAL